MIRRSREDIAKLTPCRVKRFADCAEALTEMRLLLEKLRGIEERDITPEQRFHVLKREVECRAANVIRHAESVLKQHGEECGRTWEESNTLLVELNDLFYLVPDGPENADGK